MSNGKFHHILDETDIEEWADRLGRNGRIRVVRSRPKDEESRRTREKNPRRREEKVNNNVRQVTSQNLPQSCSSTEKARQKPLPLLEKITQLSNLQRKRDEIQAQLKEIELKHAEFLAVRKEAEEKIRSQLDTITLKDLGFLQSQLITAENEEVRQVMKTLSEIANKAGQVKLAVTTENYLRTAEAFRLIWQGLTSEQREERALVARVYPDNAKAFYRSALAYQKEDLAKVFLEMIPPQWREAVEGKAPTPEVEEIEADS